MPGWVARHHRTVVAVLIGLAVSVALANGLHINPGTLMEKLGPRDKDEKHPEHS